MSPQEFVRRHESGWLALENMLGSSAKTAESLSLPSRYRQTCQHLALARERHYPPALVERLNQLVVQAHHRLYQSPQPLAGLISSFLLRDFPALVRAHAGTFWLSAFFLYGALAATAFAVWSHPGLVFSVMNAEQIHNYEQMYDPSHRVIGFDRDNASDFYMFGYYIQHNIGIGFKTFAGGMLAGVGSLVILLSNGIAMGAVAGHLTRIGFGETFWSFIVGHGAFELTAIVLCGMAGLLLGRAMIAPGKLPRGEALRMQARIAVRLVYGATLFLIIAAMLEAFWSSSTAIPVQVKYAAGAVLWLLVSLYLWRAGRNKEVADHAAV